MSKSLIVFLSFFLLSALTTQTATREQLLGSKVSLEKFEKVFSQLNTAQGKNLFAQLKSTIKTGASISTVDDKIKKLNEVIIKDQTVDDLHFKQSSESIQAEINQAEAELEQLREKEEFLLKKKEIIDDQEAKIQDLYTKDQEAYNERYIHQIGMKSALETIISLTQTTLLENPGIPETTEEVVQESELYKETEQEMVSEAFLQLKQLGRGHPVEAMAQLTRLLTKDDIQRLMGLFEDMVVAIDASVEADRVKEVNNEELFAKLFDNITVLRPKTEQDLLDVRDLIMKKEAQITELNARLQKLTDTYNTRYDFRTKAQEKSQEALELLESNMQDLVDWENLVKANKPSEGEMEEQLREEKEKMIEAQTSENQLP